MITLLEMARNTASNIRRVLQEQAQIQIDEARLKLETNSRAVKQYVDPIVPFVVLPSLGNIPSSLAMIPSRIKRTIYRRHPVSTGRVEKKRDDQSQARLESYLARQKKNEEALRRKAEERAEENHRYRLAKQKEEAELRTQYAAWIKKQNPTKTSKYQSVQPSAEPTQKEPVQEETHKQRQQFIHNSLTAILGEKGIKKPLLPSGNNPIDPVIVAHNDQVFQQTVLNQWQLHKADELRKQQEADTAQQQTEAYRQQVEARVSYYRERYLVRLEKLVSYGSDLAEGVNHFEAIMRRFNEWEAANIVYMMTWRLLSPIQDLLSDCAKEIPLEEMGAQELKRAWPLVRMEELARFLEHQYYLPAEVAEMLRRLRAVLLAVCKPTCFIHPLHIKPRLTTEESSARIKANILRLNAEATKKAAEAAKLITSEPAKSTGEAKAAQQVKSDMSTRAAILQYVTTNDAALMDEVCELVPMYGSKRLGVNNGHRRNVELMFLELLKLADGRLKVLKGDEGWSYRSMVIRCAETLNELSQVHRMVPANKTLVLLCEDVLKLWTES
ncbi:hypothetical protein GMOD_00010071 [Pyrenophora seminiperda CCB06]|uniref:Uncharacterized protein n=1 Tax=Pyrenophora seminiperda CCB06 TaxID=1302712 RepID=A0A3M7M1R5_9PLEO|nr:hypothetical protein GMOD_00010071 [Pyrenophora seminiperda CCB06]